MTSARICADCVVRHGSLCGSLADDELERLHARGRRHRLRRGDTIAWAGEKSEACGNLLSGMLKLTASAGDGREQMVGLLYPADLVGRPYADRTRFTVTAVSDSEICAFPRSSFERWLDEHPAMERQLLRRTLAALDETRGRMLMLARGSAEEKIAAFLLGLSAHAAAERNQDPVTFELPLNRGEMAELLGLTIETVSRQMRKLQDDGVIALRGLRTVMLCDRETLKRRAGPGVGERSARG